MKKVEFHSPADGDIIENPDIAFLRILILYVKDYWSFGSGAGTIYYKDKGLDKRMEIYFSEKYGFHLRIFPKNGDFFLSFGQGDYKHSVEVYVGGDPWLLPTKYFITNEETLIAVEEFAKTGEITPHVNWGKGSEETWTYGYDEEEIDE